MNFYLVRHATPKTRSGDPDLGPVGRVEAEKLGAAFAGLNLPVGSVAVLTSDAKRAHQTASAIAAALGVPEAAIRVYPGARPPLRPDRTFLASFSALATEHVVFVGHWGSVNRLYGWLVGVADDAFSVDYATAAGVSFAPSDIPGKAKSLWLTTPALLGLPRKGIVRVGPVAFDGEIKGAEDLSAAEVVGDLLVLGSDETNCVQILKRNGEGYQVVGADVILNAAAKEIDIEGIASDGAWVYVLGSHAWKRKKLKASNTYAKNKKALEEVTREKDRECVCRFRLAADGSASAVEQTSLRAVLDEHPVLKSLATVAGKENGIDLEGLTVRDGWLYAGFRSPVLRSSPDFDGGFVPVLKFRFASPVASAQTETLYLSLQGRGVRDLARVRDGFLVLAGPSGEAAMSTQVYHWDGNDCLPGSERPQPLGKLTLLGELPDDSKGAAETLALLNEDAAGYEVLIVYDKIMNGAATRYWIPRPV